VFNIPVGKNLYVPLTATDTGQAITYSVTTSNPGVVATVLTTTASTNPELQLTVHGTDASNQAFSGTITFQLFKNVAPQTVAGIVTKVNAGLYTGTSFYRMETATGFKLIQGGISRTTGKTDTTNLPDEFSASTAFNSSGLLAMANAGLNTATSEVFITAPNIPLANDPQSLNYGYTIFGQLISGADIYAKILGVPTTSSGGLNIANTPVTIDSASIITADNQNAVLQISEANNITGNFTVNVTATGADTSAVTRSFNINIQTPTAASGQPLVIAPVSDQVTTAGTPISFQVSESAASTLTPTFTITDASGFRVAPSNVSVRVTPGTGTSANTATVTLTPASGFTGTLNLVAHVDNSSTVSSSSLHDASIFKLTVNAAATNTSGVASLVGTVYLDANGNGAKDSGEFGIAGVVMTLTGSSTGGTAQPTQSVVTDSNGAYLFNIATAGTYAVTETQPSKFNNGTSQVGTSGGTAGTNTITGISIASSAAATGYNFSEKSITQKSININYFLASTPGTQTLLTNAAAPTSDSSPVVASIAKDSVDPSSAASVDFTVTFNKEVTGVNATDFAVAASSGITGASIASVSGSGKTYTVTVNTGTGSGTLGLNLNDDDTIVDALSHALGGTGTGNGNYIGPAYTMSKVAAISVAINSPVSPINIANKLAVGVSGTATAGTTISLTITDGTHTTSAATATASTGGTWSVTGIDASALTDGTVTYNVTATNGLGGVGTGSQTGIKDTVVPTLSITAVTSPIGITTSHSFALSGTSVASAGIHVVATDGTTTITKDTTADSSGNWTASAMNISGLNDGTITFTVTATDAGSNTAQQVTTATKLTLAISNATDPVNNANEASTSISGTSQAGVSISVVINDGVHTTSASTTTVQSDGTWTLTGLDATNLNNGTLTYVVTATDSQNNSVTRSKTVTKSATV
jgi:cyclophilin family peptidyl-prolyl cis-trans isomerase